MKTKAAAFAVLIASISSLALAQTSGTTEQPCWTQGQAIKFLESEGYSDIKLSEVSPGALTIRPEISCQTPSGAVETTRTHTGWNGTAVKGGKTYDVMVDAAGRVTTR